MCGKKCEGGKCSSGCVMTMVAKVLVIVGGVNWGLVGLGMLLKSDWNVVKMLLGGIPTLEAVVYLLVGVAAVMMLGCCKCKKCVGVCKTDSTTEPAA